MEASGRRLWLVLHLALAALIFHEGACAVDECQIKINGQLQQAAALQMEEFGEMKAMLVYVLQNQPTKTQIETIAGKVNRIQNDLELLITKVEKIEAMVELAKTPVQGNGNQSKLIHECQQWLQTQNVNQSNFFRAEDKNLYISLTEKKYFYYNETELLPWNGAHDWCVENGMQLAMLKTQIQLNAVARQVNKYNLASYFYWLGASDVGRTAGQFRWTDGTLVDGTTWYGGTINKKHQDCNETTCVEFDNYDATLTNEKCSKLNHFLCQVPTALAACL